MRKGRSGPASEDLERDIEEILSGDGSPRRKPEANPTETPRLSVRRARDRGRSGFRVSGRDKFGESIDLFVRKKAAADSIRDVYHDVADRDERMRRVKNLLHWDAGSDPDASRSSSSTRVDPQVNPRPPTTEQAAAGVTRRAVREVPPAGRFGPDKVFISAIYDRVAPDLGWSLDQFKRWLVRANQDQILDLARADSQGDMDPDLLQRSEIVDRGAAFHFVVDRADQGRARGS